VAGSRPSIGAPVETEARDAARAVTLTLPAWVGEVVSAFSSFESVEERMRLAVALARENVRRHAGGPFGAAVFLLRDRMLVSIGVNSVLRERASVAHAEIMALLFAQQEAGTHDLGAVDGGCELVTSVEPCAMCLGAVPWAHVRRLVCGARDEDARAAGFDEGAKPADWPRVLAGRGIEVVRDVLREDAASVLREYRESGGPIY